MTASSPWHRLTQLAGGKGVSADWRDFPQSLLTITQESASALPCERRGGCYMSVIRHGPGDYVAVCPSEAQDCHRRTLSKAELALYRIDHQKLAARLAEALGFEAQLERIKEHEALWRFGILTPRAEQCVPVHGAFSQTPGELEMTLTRLCLSEPGPFLLIAAASNLISHASAQASHRHKARLIGLDQVLDVDARGRVRAKASARTMITNWLQTVLPKSARPGSEYRFPTPAGASWAHMTFEFTATEVLLVICRHANRPVQERLEPEHLKMKNHKSGRPTLQWLLLQSLATTGGSLSWRDAQASDRVKKQKQALADKLKQTFGLSQDPIPWTPHEKCYRCRFTIRAADPVLRQMAR